MTHAAALSKSGAPARDAGPRPDHADLYPHTSRLRELANAWVRATGDGTPSGRDELGRFLLDFVDVDKSNGDLLAHLVAEAMLQRLDGGLLQSRNVYLQALEESQTDLFYLTAKALPVIDAGHQVANQFLARGLVDCARGAVLDLGVGHGTQIEKLLRRLGAEPGALRELVVLGVDPLESNLLSTRRRIDAVRDQLPFTVTFVPLATMIEALAPGQVLRHAERAPWERLVINSAFAFHHVAHPPGSGDARRTILRRLVALKPSAVTLVEPDVDHDTDDLVARLHHCWLHFGCVFELIDESPLRPSERLAVKAHFFGREIRDIFGVDDRFRCERHEPNDAWRAHLGGAGLRPMSLVHLDVELPPYCAHEVEQGLVRLTYRELSLVAVLGYRMRDEGGE